MEVDEGDCLLSMHYHPHTGVIESRRFSSKKASEILAKRLAKKLQNPSYDCQASFILEPLKVRAVTAGPVVPYWILKPFQKALWTYLKDHRAFTLVGKPVTEDYLNELFLKDSDHPWAPSAWDEDDDRFLESGDYSAATDNLRAHFSRFTWDLLMERGDGPQWVRRIGSKSLVGHTVHYDPKLKLAPVKQWNGQLMGSILSFPILCIVNAAVCRLAYHSRLGLIENFREEVNWQPNALYQSKSWADLAEEEDVETHGSFRFQLLDQEAKEELCRQRRRVPLSKLPIGVNGDDCTMLYNAKERAVWARFAEHIGMEPSVGKCYTAKDWLQINSTGFMLVDWAAGPANGLAVEKSFQRSAFINFGLLTDKKIRGGQKRTFTDLGECAREFLHGHPTKDHEWLMSIFIKYHSRQGGLLRDVPSGMSWWLPEHLGGLGLPWTRPIEDLDREISPRQRMMATMILNSLQLNSARRPPHPKGDDGQFYFSGSTLEAKTGRKVPEQISAWKPIRPFPAAENDFPEYVSRAIAKDRELEIPETSLCEEPLSEHAFVKDRVDASYLSSLWDCSFELPLEREELMAPPFVAKACTGETKALELKRVLTRKWEKLWKKSKAERGFAPLDVLMSSVLPKFVLPGGVQHVLESARSLPSGLLGRITAIWEREKGIAELRMMPRLVADVSTW